MKKITLFLTMVAVTVCSNAADKKNKSHENITDPTPKVWEKEPDSVFGVKLGLPLSESDIRECLKTKFGTLQIPQEKCIYSNGKNPEENVYLFFLPIDYLESAALFFSEGAVSGLDIKMPHAAYQTFRSILIEKYGQPTSIENNVVQAGSGAKFSSENLTWVGKKNVLVFAERSGTIDKSSATFSNVVLVQKTIDKKNNAIKNDAEKM